MSEPLIFEPEELRRNAEWVRGLARRLVADEHLADDLAQDTWMAALEHPPGPAAPSRSWLSAVLLNALRKRMRTEVRRVERERAAATAGEATPAGEIVGQVESLRLLVNAVLALEEPIRSTILLRYYGDLSAAEIARRTSVPPGTVRSRLKRGLASLRARLDAEHAGGRREWVLSVLPLLKDPAASMTAASMATFTGGALMGGKILLAAGAAILIAWTAWNWQDRGTPENVADSRTDYAQAPPSGEPAWESASPAPPERRQVIETETAGGVPLRGRIVDSESGQGLAGARVRFDPPREMTRTELLREFPGRVWQSRNGSLRSDGGPPLPEPADFWSPSGERRLPVYARPAPGSSPMATATSEADGSFTVPAPSEGGVLSVELRGYGATVVVVKDPRQETLIELCRPRPLSGYVIDPQGRRLERPFHFLFQAIHQGDQDGTIMWNSPNTWPVETEADGSFATELPAEWVWARSQTPGFELTQLGMHPQKKKGWVFQLNFHPGQEPDPVILVAATVPTLRVRERGRPVEDFHLLGHEIANDYVRWAGRFHATSGLLPLIHEVSSVTTLEKSAFQFTVWTEHHAPQTVRVTDLTTAGIIDLELTPGTPPSVSGLVLDDGLPAADLVLELIGHSPMQWRLDENWILDRAVTDDAGAFRFGAPEGLYLLRVVNGDRSLMRTVTIPGTEPLVIDLSRTATLRVEVRGSDGESRAGHVVALRDTQGRSERSHTDEQGFATFENLPAGEFRVMVPHVTTEGSFAPEIVEVVTLRPGETGLLQVTVPSKGAPHYPRLVVDPPAPFGDFEARSLAGWVGVQSNGTINIDVQMGVNTLQIRSQGGALWDVDIPSGAPDGYVIRIQLGPLRYVGRLLKSGSERPLAGIRVIGRPIDQVEGPMTRPSCITDRAGRFVLPCAVETPHSFTFRSPQADGRAGMQSVPVGWIFHAAAAPSDAPEALVIRLPADDEDRASEVQLTGRVLRRDVLAPVSNARLWFRCLDDSAAGTLERGPRRGTERTDADGAFVASLPRADRWKISISTADQKRLLEEIWVPGATDRQERDFFVP